jgi:hypothetical protein
MLDPDPADAPVVPPDGLSLTIHEKVVPVTLLAKAIEVMSPEQIIDEAGVAVAVGNGLTVITTLTGVPVHPLADGVTV